MSLPKHTDLHKKQKKAIVACNHNQQIYKCRKFANHAFSISMTLFSFEHKCSELESRIWTWNHVQKLLTVGLAE